MLFNVAFNGDVLENFCLLAFIVKIDMQEGQEKRRLLLKHDYESLNLKHKRDQVQQK